MERLPLFPLNVVLFPGMPLPLHIFEERYQQMIGECMEHRTPFGVCLIAEGQEVGAPAEPHAVGTTAEIVASEPLGGGRLNLMTVGRRRFRIQEIVQQRPYLAADVEYLPDDPASAGLERLADEVRAELQGYVGRLLEIVGEEPAALDMPGEPEALSFFAIALVQLPNDEKQALLETTDTETRLRRCLDYIQLVRKEQEELLERKREGRIAVRLDPTSYTDRISPN